MRFERRIVNVYRVLSNFPAWTRCDQFPCRTALSFAHEQTVLSAGIKLKQETLFFVSFDIFFCLRRVGDPLKEEFVCVLASLLSGSIFAGGISIAVFDTICAFFSVALAAAVSVFLFVMRLAAEVGRTLTLNLCSGGVTEKRWSYFDNILVLVCVSSISPLDHTIKGKVWCIACLWAQHHFRCSFYHGRISVLVPARERDGCHA